MTIEIGNFNYFKKTLKNNQGLLHILKAVKKKFTFVV